MHKLSSYLTIFTLALVLAACGAEDDTPIEPTQTAIQAEIFNKGCTASSCHDAGAEGGLDLRASAVPDSLINAESEKSTLPRVAPGDPDGSFLVRKLEGTLGGSEGDLMPLGGPKLGANKIKAVREWIADLPTE